MMRGGCLDSGNTRNGRKRVHIVPSTTAKLVERTQELCPYSKATAGNVPTEVVVVKSLD